MSGCAGEFSMTELLLIRTPDGFRPNSIDDAHLLKRWKVGELAMINVTKPRNSLFHRKFFALLDVAFDAWEPPEQEYKGMRVQKNRERFRKDLVIAAGFYDVVANIKGEVRAEAKSISFANMDDIEFEKVYSKIVDVVLQTILTRYTREDLDRVIEQVLGFT